MKQKSIRYYFFTSITTVLVASALLMGLIQFFLVSNYVSDDKERHLEMVLKTVTEVSRSGGDVFNFDAVDDLHYIYSVSEADVMLTDPAGKVLYSEGTHVFQPGDAIPANVMRQLMTRGTYSETGTMDGMFQQAHYNRAMPVLGAGGVMLGYAFACITAEGMNVYLLNTLSTFALSTILVLLLASVLSLFLYNRTIIPLRRVSEAARHFGEGDFSVRVPVTGDDELARLALTFNEMANTLQATDSTRRSFMGNIAHELRTPMTSIKGFIDGMLDGTIPQDQRERYLQLVSGEVGRLARLTNNMLDISRLEAGEYTLKAEVMDLREIAATVFLSAQRRLSIKNLNVVSPGGDAPVWVLADQDCVHQVLYNLLDNAIKFANPGGIITFSVRPARDTVTITLRNTGQGMPPEVVARVFDRFYKADQSRGENIRGAGLGLHISRVLVGLMGGHMQASSQEGD